MKRKYYLEFFTISITLIVFLSAGFVSGAGGEWLLDVWGASNDVFVVGSASTRYGSTAGNIILHWDGSAWHKMSTRVLNSLHGIWGTSKDNVYAVGAGGIVLHYDGHSWSAVVEPGELADDLRALWGSSESDVFAVGIKYESSSARRGVILHYNGSLWKRVYIDAADNCQCLYAIWGTSKSDIFAGGYSCILHYDGYGWTKVPISLTHSITGIWGTSPANVYAVDSHGGVYRYNGDVWEVIRNPMYDNDGGDIWGSSDNDIFIVGDNPYPEPYPNYDPVIFHFDGIHFQEMEYPTSNYLEAIWGTCRTNIYAVGGHGTIVYFDGDSWSLVRTEIYQSVSAFSLAFGSKTDDNNYDSDCDFDSDGDVDGLDLVTLAEKIGC